MAPSPISYLTLADLCERWHVKAAQIGAVALEGKIRLSIPVPGVHVEIGYYEEYGPGDWGRIPEEYEFLRGVFDLTTHDAWNLIRNGSAEIGSFATDVKDGYIHINETPSRPSFTVVSDDILIRRDEVERFEANSAPAPRDASETSAARGGPGAPPKYDWDGFWIEACRHIHDEGIPPTQAAMVRDLLDWFDKSGSAAPDPSTVKKKVSRLWKALQVGSSAMRGIGSGIDRNSRVDQGAA